jgi:cadmium resistance protein CadD (predicted permease)
MIFLALLLVIITSNLAKSGQVQLARQIDRWSRVLFPLMLLLTLTAFL